MRKEIDINPWERKEHFEFFSKIATPHYCVAFNIAETDKPVTVCQVIFKSF